MKNKTIFYEFAKQLESDTGLKVYDVIFSDGYLFEEEEDSVVQFKIKELKNWLFGAWILKNEQKEKYLLVFCQYELFIDKFKPSRGNFDIKVTYRDKEFNIFELSEALEFMQDHEAIFFCRQDNPYYYISEWRAKLKMHRTIRIEKKYRKQQKNTYKLIQKAIKIAAKLKIFQTMYDKDDFNGENCHINDIYYIYTPNLLSRILSRYLQHRVNKFYDLGNIWIYNNKAVWMAEYNGMRYDEPPSTKEEIAAECSDIKEKQKTEYKRQYDKLIKYIWED